MRADIYVSKAGYTVSREAARRCIEAGLVTVDGKKVSKPSEQIDDTAEHTVVCGELVPYVSRGGLKLEAAFSIFGIDVDGMSAVDIGASTGGFTDCLLKHGAARVCAVDAGHGQLSQSLASDSRVISIEGLNARAIDNDDLPFLSDIAVMDVSFISQTYILPRIPALLKPDGILISLIKPQFEVGREGVGKGGIVRSSKLRRSAVERVITAAAQNDLYAVDACQSPILGGDGNAEYLVVFSRSPHDIAVTMAKLEFD